jgi:uncharacterized membrane protein YsdA (DUF1294 family)
MNMRRVKEPKIITLSYVKHADGSMSGVSMYRHHARKEKIKRLLCQLNNVK